MALDILTGVAKPFLKAEEIGKRAILDIGPAILDVFDYFFPQQVYQNVNHRQIQSQTSMQSRYQSVQNYNNTFNLTAPEEKLWVTPGGTVVDWNGNVIAEAPEDDN